MNCTVFYSEGGSRSAGITVVDVENAWGYGLNMELDDEFSPNGRLNVDVKKRRLRPDVSVNRGAVTATTDLDPWIIGAAVRYRF